MHFKKKTVIPIIDPDEVFLDSHNLPLFDTQQFEGQFEKTITKQALYLLIGTFFIVILIFIGKIFNLEINQGKVFAERSERNTLRYTSIFSQRGVIYDRQGLELAWNNPERIYRQEAGTASVLGYLGYSNESSTGSLNFDPKELI